MKALTGDCKLDERPPVSQAVLGPAGPCGLSSLQYAFTAELRAESRCIQLGFKVSKCIHCPSTVQARRDIAVISSRSLANGGLGICKAGATQS